MAGLNLDGVVRRFGPTLAVETVEHWFERLSLAAQGRPSALDGLPMGTRCGQIDPGVGHRPQPGATDARRTICAGRQGR